MVRNTWIIGLILLVAVMTTPFVVHAEGNPTLDHSHREISSDIGGSLSTEVLAQLEAIDEIVEQQILDGLRGKGIDDARVSIQSTTSIPIGANRRLTSATEGQNSGYQNGMMSNWTSSYNLSTRQNNVGAWATFAGPTSAWAWTGHRFDVVGTGSRQAVFSVYGYYSAALQGATYGDTAQFAMDLRLYDATAGQWVKSSAICNHVENGSYKTHVDQYTDKYLVDVTLIGGHQYVILVQSQATATSMLLNATSESGNSLHCSNWGDISLVWFQEAK